jgi:hypothetical protein
MMKTYSVNTKSVLVSPAVHNTGFTDRSDSEGDALGVNIGRVLVVDPAHRIRLVSELA